MSLSSETWSQTTRINTHRHTPKLLYFSDIAVNCLVCNISTEKLPKTKTTSLNNRRTLFLVFTLPFVQLKTHNRLFIVIKTFKEGGVGGKSIYCFDNFHNHIAAVLFPSLKHHWTDRRWMKVRAEQQRETGKGRSLGRFNSSFLSKTKPFLLHPLGPAIHTLQSDSQKCFASCVENWSTRSPLSHKSPLSDRWATEQNYLY